MAEAAVVLRNKAERQELNILLRRLNVMERRERTSRGWRSRQRLAHAQYARTAA